MPKKTKREKIIATYHKKLKLLEIQNSRSVNVLQIKEPGINKESTIKPKIIINKKITNNIDIINEDKIISNYFKIDFKKSSIIIVIIILLEFSLYFASINHYLKF